MFVWFKRFNKYWRGLHYGEETPPLFIDVVLSKSPEG
jgi:hypothetical protein